MVGALSEQAASNSVATGANWAIDRSMYFTSLFFLGFFGRVLTYCPSSALSLILSSHLVQAHLLSTLQQIIHQPRFHFQVELAI